MFACALVFAGLAAGVGEAVTVVLVLVLVLLVVAHDVPNPVNAIRTSTNSIRRIVSSRH